MAQKPNKSGQMQEYIPAGNGDASGEYADNGGSNKHFTAFGKPQNPEAINGNLHGNPVGEKPQEKQETPEETETQQFDSNDDVEQLDNEVKELTNQEKLDQLKKDLEDKTIWNDLSKKQKRELADYISYYSNKSIDETIKDLRYYSGNFGDLTGYSDEELTKLINTLRNDVLTKEVEKGYIVDKNKTKKTSRPNLHKLLGEKVFSSMEEILLVKQQEAKKVLDSIQTKQDKELEKIFTNGCAVCIGKNFPKEVAKQVGDAITTVNKDFGDMANFVNAIGGRNEIEKYLNALQDINPPNEDEIQAEIERIKKYTTYYGDNTEEKYRATAIKNLTSHIDIAKLNNAIAYWSSSTKRLVFMAKMKNFDDAKTKDLYDRNWFSSDKGIGVLYHEYGHGVDSMMDKLEQKISSGDYDDIAFYKAKKIFYDGFSNLRNQNKNSNYEKEFNKRLAEAGFSMDSPNYEYNVNKAIKEREIKKQLAQEGIKEYALSKYGDTDNHEFTAECFNAYYTGQNNPIATKVVELYKNYYNALKEIEKGNA